MAYNMCAAPALRHQGLVEQDEDDVDTVVQPDLIVVCDRSKLRPNGIWGAPDFVVEILSPSTSRKDLHEKYALYERAGVKEYWVIDPTGHWLQQYVLGPQGRYEPEVLFVEQGAVSSVVIECLKVEVAGLWQDI